MSFTLSPSVTVTEVDLTTTVPQVSTTIGGMVSPFQWGTVDEVTTVVSEVDLLNQFNKPNDDIFADWFTAANFLSYSNNLKVVRIVGASAINAGITGATPGVGVTKLVKNEDDYEATAFGASELFVAKYPGVLGNAIRVHFADSGNYSEWKYRNEFNGTPATSSYASDAGGANDELHVIVIDETGAWTGVAGTVLEKFEYISKASDARRIDGSSNYVKTVLQNESDFVWLGSPAQMDPAMPAVASTTWTPTVEDGFGDSVDNVTFDSDGTAFSDGVAVVGVLTFSAPASGTTATATVNIVSNAPVPGTVIITNTGSGYASAPTVTWVGGGDVPSNTVVDMESTGKGGAMLGGVDDNGAGVTTGIRQQAIDLFSNVEEEIIDLFMQANGGPAVGDYIIDNLATTRKDIVAFVSPAQASVVNNAGDELADIKTDGTTMGSSSYAFMDSAYKYQFDKYNDVFRWVPMNGDMAGLAAQTDTTNDPWFSPAGFNRGAVKNAVKLSWVQSKADRDALYGAGINPIVNFSGQGITLFGDKTMLDRPSAFSRINVRRLFIVIERAIADASRFFLFEQNDAFTRNQFKSMIEPFLRDIQGRRGLTDFSVVVDETNNTPQVIDSNQLVGDIFIRPTRTINFIRLKFTAVRTGVDFSTVGG